MQEEKMSVKEIILELKAILQENKGSGTSFKLLYNIADLLDKLKKN